MTRQKPIPNDIEKKLSDEDFIVSKTDKRGVITYVNKAFLDIVGYTEEELIGTAHNIVRHPDMPKAAFADLWNTIRDGKDWHGIVKNLCKDGSFYWVKAMVTPSYLNGELIGYMSVRRQANEEEIQNASNLYKEMIKDEQ